ncbi:LPS O-antigen chain length determinant protein WzzB [Pantoea sp. BIGb0393]|uniref:Chain length determinant protein n=1 Tax=Pantoea nemavictus TaxID=2726955 RepID=A0ABU8PMW9_9GAMM|nr:LPS O-antigen chain length determinant protein WzzB [Pantoea nemavictus]MBA0035095.1 LPS O-antigen chain length determinant protein WzzB [Pantoea nemavictus]
MKESERPDSDNSISQQALYNNDDEVDLIDIIVQLWKGKLIILAAMVLTVALSLVYLSVVKEKWTSKAIVTLPSAGQVANYNATLSTLYAQNPQDKPSITDLQNQMFTRFNSSMSALSGSLANLEKPLTLRIDQVNKGSNDSLAISFVAETARQAQEQLTKYISAVNEDVVDDYGLDLKKNLGIKAKELSNILDAHKQIAINKKQHRIDVINQALKVAKQSGINKSQLNQAEYLSDDTLYLLGSDALNAMIVNEATKPLDFDDDYYNAERALLAVTHVQIQTDNLQSFRYIAKADLPLRRDSPKKTLTVLLALILGGVLGSSIVIGRNVVKGYRNRH